MGYVVASAVKDLIKKQNMNTAGNFAGALDKEIEELVKRAAERAKKNGRKTVREEDV